SALNRIRWSSHTPAITATVGVSAQGARAAAVARLTRPKIETETERQKDLGTERGRDRETERPQSRETEGRKLTTSVPPSLTPSISSPIRLSPGGRASGRQASRDKDADAEELSRRRPKARIETGAALIKDIDAARASADRRRVEDRSAFRPARPRTFSTTGAA